MHAERGSPACQGICHTHPRQTAGSSRASSPDDAQRCEDSVKQRIYGCQTRPKWGVRTRCQNVLNRCIHIHVCVLKFSLKLQKLAARRPQILTPRVSSFERMSGGSADPEGPVESVDEKREEENCVSFQVQEMLSTTTKNAAPASKEAGVSLKQHIDKLVSIIRCCTDER